MGEIDYLWGLGTLLLQTHRGLSGGRRGTASYKAAHNEAGIISKYLERSCLFRGKVKALHHGVAKS